MLQNFPDELILEILSHLPILDIVNGAQHVCRRWQSLCQNPSVWRGKERRINGRENIHDIVETAKLTPLTTALSIGCSRDFFAWFTGSYLFLSSHLNYSDLRAIIKNLNIKRLSIPRNIFDLCYRDLINANTNVESLIIYSNGVVSQGADETFRHLVEQGYLRELTALYLYNAREISTATVSLLGQHCTNLEELCFHQVDRITGDGLESLKNCTKLSFLQITESNTFRELSFLKNCPSIMELDLSRCYSLRPPDLQHLLHLKNLKRFHLRHTHVTGLPLSAMGESLKHLELIDLYYTSGFSERDVHQLKLYAPHILVCKGAFNFEKHR